MRQCWQGARQIQQEPIRTATKLVVSLFTLALATALLSLDYEKDDYDTPRIAGVVGDDTAFVGIVRRDALLVREVTEPMLVATYEKDTPEAYDFDAADAEDAAREVLDAPFEHAVCAAGVVRDGDGFSLASLDD